MKLCCVQDKVVVLEIDKTVQNLGKYLVAIGFEIENESYEICLLRLCFLPKEHLGWP